MDKKPYNQISEIGSAINTVKRLVSEKAVEDKFKKIIKIANSNFDKDLEEYEDEVQDILIDFTRIFNLSQLIYIFKTYKIETIENFDSMTHKLEKIMENLLKSSEYDTVNSYLESMDVMSLLDDEIDSCLDDEKEQDLQYRVYKIGFIAYEIEKDFQLKDWNLKLQSLNRNPIANTFFKNKITKFKERVQKEKEIWKQFEQEYNDFLNVLKSNFKNEEVKSEKEEEDVFCKIMEERASRSITYVDDVLKNTITFKQYVDEHKDKDFAKDFMTLYNDYASKFNIDTVNTTLLSGHIYYFRLLTITKMILLMQEFGIENMYYNYDMIQVIGEPLTNTDQSDISGLLCMDQETAYALIHNDLAFFIPENANLDDRQMYQYLFCIYLNIENQWQQYALRKDLEKAEKKYEKTLVKTMHTNADVINNFFEEYSDKIKFSSIKNQTMGKIIDFPS